MARPSGCTPALIAAIATRVEHGCVPEVAAGAEGVPRRTFARWKARGEAAAESEEVDDTERPYLELWHALARASDLFEAECARYLTTGESDYVAGKEAAIQYMLERARRERWGNKIELVAQKSAVDQVLDALARGMDPEAYAQAVRVLAGEDTHGSVPDGQGTDP